MAERTLNIVLHDRGHVMAIKDGAITLPSARLCFTDVPTPMYAARRMIRELAYDICELPIVPYLCAKMRGQRFTALPIFVLRGLHHRALATRAGAEADPRNLAGHVVAVNRGYTVTTGVWARAVLEVEFGVDLRTVSWQPTDDEHPAQFVCPENVLPPTVGMTVQDLLIDGSVSAAVGQVPFDDPRVVPLIADPDAGLVALRDRGWYPINHMIVVRDDILEEVPTLVSELFDAFVHAKSTYLNSLRVRRTRGDLAPSEIPLTQVMDVIGDDPLPYGIGPNKEMLRVLFDHCARQGIGPVPRSPEDIFAESSLMLVG